MPSDCLVIICEGNIAAGKTVLHPLSYGGMTILNNVSQHSATSSVICTFIQNQAINSLCYGGRMRNPTGPLAGPVSSRACSLSRAGRWHLHLADAQADALQLAGLLLDADQRPAHDGADLGQRHARRCARLHEAATRA